MTSPLPTGLLPTGLLPYRLFASPDGRGDLRLVFNDSVGEIIQITVNRGVAELEEASDVPSDWIELHASPAGAAGHDSSDEEKAVHHHVRHWLTSWTIIPNGVARTIAARWQDSRDPALAALATSGVIDQVEVWRSLDALLRSDMVDSSPDPISARQALIALRVYVTHHGDRDPVPGWATLWAAW